MRAPLGSSTSASLRLDRAPRSSGLRVDALDTSCEVVVAHQRDDTPSLAIELVGGPRDHHRLVREGNSGVTKLGTAVSRRLVCTRAAVRELLAALGGES